MPCIEDLVVSIIQQPDVDGDDDDIDDDDIDDADDVPISTKRKKKRKDQVSKCSF